jgi:deoxyadenosine/deoxycytidine kinase
MKLDKIIKDLKMEVKTIKNSQFNENEATIYQHLWDTMKAVLRGKLIALNASKKKLDRAYTSSLTVRLKVLEQKEVNSPRGVEGRK